MDAIYIFDDYRLDIGNAQLRKMDREIALPPKAFAMLAYLVEHQGLLVTKDELLDAVWGRRYVTEGVLKTTAQILRQALSDDSKTPRYLETVHRRGYRFIAEAIVSSGYTARQLSVKFDFEQPLLVGRGGELQQLQYCLNLAASGKPQLVFLTGEAGIGKTALIEHFLAANAGQVVIGRGQCVEHYGQSEPYLPILEALNGVCRQQGEIAVNVLAHTAPDWLAELPWLNHRNQLKSSSQQIAPNSQARMLRELGELLERWTQDLTLLWVLEDLHWSDWATLDVLAFLARRKNPARWLIIASYRPELTLSANQALAQIVRDLQLHRLAKEIALPLLSEIAVKDYLQRRCGADKYSPELFAAIYRRSEGLPFFVTQLAENIDRLSGDLLQELPEGVQQLIEQQFHRLPADLQKLLSAASVAGAVFNVPLLAELLGQDATAVETHCESLCRNRHFLGRVKTGFLHEEGNYVFLHAYYHEYVYQRLPAIAKSNWHRQTAYWLEQHAPISLDDTVSSLALHFEKGRVFDKAVDYLLKAAANALKRQASHEVIALSQRALTVLEQHFTEIPEPIRNTIALNIQAGIAMRAIQSYGAEEQYRFYRQVLALVGQIDDVKIHLPLAFFHLIRLELIEAEKYARQLLDLAIPHKLDYLELSANLIMASISFTKANSAFMKYAHKVTELYGVKQWGNNSGTAHSAGKVIALHKPNLDATLLSYSAQHPVATLGLMRTCHDWLQGYPQRALQNQQYSLAAAKELEHSPSIAFAFAGMAICKQLIGHWQGMADYCEQAIALAEQYKFDVAWRWSLILKGLGLVGQGQVGFGLEFMQTSIADYLETGSKTLATYFLACYTDACLEHRQLEDANNTLQQALDMMNNYDERFFEAELYRLQGELILVDSPLHSDVAEVQFNKALAVSELQGAKALALRSAVSLARMYRTQDRLDDARRVLHRAYSQFNEGFDTLDLQQARLLLDTF